MKTKCPFDEGQHEAESWPTYHLERFHLSEPTPISSLHFYFSYNRFWSSVWPHLRTSSDLSEALYVRSNLSLTLHPWIIPLYDTIDPWTIPLYDTIDPWTFPLYDTIDFRVKRYFSM